MNTCLSVYPSYVEWESPVLVTTLDGKNSNSLPFRVRRLHIYARFLHVRDTIVVKFRAALLLLRRSHHHSIISAEASRERTTHFKERETDRCPGCGGPSVNQSDETGRLAALPSPLRNGPSEGDNERGAVAFAARTNEATYLYDRGPAGDTIKTNSFTTTFFLFARPRPLAPIL